MLRIGRDSQHPAIRGQRGPGRRTVLVPQDRILLIELLDSLGETFDDKAGLGGRRSGWGSTLRARSCGTCEPQTVSMRCEGQVEPERTLCFKTRNAFAKARRLSGSLSAKLGASRLLVRQLERGGVQLAFEPVDLGFGSGSVVRARP